MRPKNIALFCFGLLLAACGRGGPKELQITHVGVSVCEPAFGIFRTQAEWDGFWASHKPYGRQAEVPRVDLDRFVAVLVSTGRDNAGAATPAVTRAVLAEKHVAEVTIRTVRAGEGCAVTRAVVCPTDLALLPRGDYSVRLIEETMARGCRLR